MKLGFVAEQDLALALSKQLGILYDAGVPAPQVNVKVGGLEADLVWRRWRFLVEIDGKAYTGEGPAINSGFLDGLGVVEHGLDPPGQLAAADLGQGGVLEHRAQGGSHRDPQGDEGLGAAVCNRLIWEGARVALCARNLRKLEATADTLRAQGGEVLALPAVQQGIRAFGYRVLGGPAEDFAVRLQRESAYWADLVKRNGLSLV